MERREKPKKDFSLDKKNGPLFRDPFFNAWSGKRNSHLASDILKPKELLLFLKQNGFVFKIYKDF
ncbi:hypothetical protein BK661_05335 [Pseudomonas frederiksbergensis]|uniref:Uncharacterized protein n=1 Tax=Pseudomonas frederiksbergensis TaxID=104087 RepID=A0A423JDJ5_9PSED|nr:hypothetical protein BK661_05335 [Pseudomonas frederiksbergensis]